MSRYSYEFMPGRIQKFIVTLAASTVVLLGAGHAVMPRVPHGVAQAAVLRESPAVKSRTPETKSAHSEHLPKVDPVAEPSKVVLTRSASWFVYPKGCAGVRNGYDLVVHFHGAHTTVIPRYLKSGLEAVLVIVNKGIGSGAYSNALALRSDVDGLFDRIAKTIAAECGVAAREPKRIALSSWSAGYGGTQQVLRLSPNKIDAVLLSDGLHVGFTDARRRKVRVDQMSEFADFAQKAARGEKLMAIAHSAITPPEYASAGETALSLADAAHAPSWPVMQQRFGMTQLTAARRGQFFVDGFAGNDKAAHANHLYAIDRTSFARLRQYWKR